MIIHYSDQYNMTSSGYDAITVTRKSGQYQEVISRYLSSNGVESADRYSRRIINIFNALNGDWLLRMLSYKSHFPMEKISILSAMKLAIKRYSSGNVIWVPVSLEEIFRVSGSVGLPQSESDFSPKNLGFEGQTSDDLLLIGILNEEKVKVSFYPVEVKTGRVEEDYLEKGIRQVTKTCDILKKILGTGSCLDKDIKTRLYRNFFMQQAVVSAEKMLMYEVGEKDFKWKDITESDLRRKLLNEEYEIVPSLIPEMGTAGVISFRNDCIRPREFRRSSQESNILIVEETGKQGINLLIKEFKDIPSAEWTNIKDFSEQEINDFPEELSQKTVMEQQENILLSENMQPVVQEDDRESALIKKEPEVSAHPVRILIGEDPYKNKVYWEFGNKALANRHLLITGTSGQGKTYCIQTLLYELNKRNISAVIFDYTEGFTPQQLEPFFKEQLKDELEEKNVYRIGVPVNPFRRQMVEMAGEAILEKEADVAARLADIFVHVYSFGDQQYSAIFDAAYNGLVKYGDRMNMNLFQDELELVADKNKSARSVISKMSPFFHTVEFNSGSAFDWGKILYAEKAKINIIQLSMFTEEIKVIITEMMLWDMWYYTKKVGTKDKPFVVVLDEAQNLSHSVKSPTKAILTEGRKFGWSGWFATQSLGVLKNDEIVRLLQAAFKLYFKPADNEIIKTARQLDVTGEKDWLSEVQNLKKGQCIAVGDKMKSNGKVGPAAPTITSVTSFEKRKP